MATTDYTNPLKIIVDDNTGLLVLTDDTGKRLARAETPAGLMSLAKSKGVNVGDLPAPTDPREGSNPKNEPTAAESAPAAAAETPMSEKEVANIKAAAAPPEQRNPEPEPENTKQAQAESASTTNPTDASGRVINDPRRTDSATGGLNSVDGTALNDPIKVSAKKVIEARANSNPLFEYVDYTYGLSLHIIPPDKYNDIALKPNYVYKNNDNTVLIASAGRRDNVDFQRNARFNEDFYFENLAFKTVVGMNARNKNGNTIEVNFTVIEPYGITLLNRLLQVAGDIKVKSWMQMPFMLQIDFFGNNEQGELLTPIKNQTKNIPIKLIGCKIKVSSKGAEYQIQGIPFNHQAFSETTASTPAFLEVTAKTVKDFFSSVGSAGEADSITKVQSAVTERVESDMRDAKDMEKDDPNSDALDRRYKSLRIADKEKNAKALSRDGVAMPYLVGSYTAAMNSYQQQLVDNKHQEFPEIYEFVFDSEIAETKIVVPAKTAASKTPMATLNTPAGIASIRAQAGLSTAPMKIDVETFTINAGTNIVEVINLVMRNSDYIRNQVSDPAVDPQTAANKQEKPIDWYKIIPVIEINNYDAKLDRYSKKITYHVKKYTYFNSKFRDVQSSTPDYYSKEYNYMYTGKNQDIITFDIDFDTMFYTAITADRSKIQATAVQKAADEPDADKTEATDKPVSIQNKVTHPVSGQADMVSSASPDSKGTLVNDLAKSMMTSSRGDMINVKLKIIGDPEMIKQDDVYYNPANNPTQRTGQVIDPKSGSIIFDDSEVFVLLKFKSPTDYDPATGLMEWGTVETSVFSGIYRIITVDNEFSNGVFTQTLDLIRMFDQTEYDTLEGSSIKSKSSIERARNPTTIAESQKPPLTESDEFTGVDQAVADRKARAEAEAADQFNNPVTSSSAESPNDTSYDQLENSRTLKKALADVPVTISGDVIDTSGNIVDLGLG